MIVVIDLSTRVSTVTPQKLKENLDEIKMPDEMRQLFLINLTFLLDQHSVSLFKLYRVIALVMRMYILRYNSYRLTMDEALMTLIGYAVVAERPMAARFGLFLYEEVSSHKILSRWDNNQTLPQLEAEYRTEQTSLEMLV